LFSIFEYLKRSSIKLEGNEDNFVIDDIDGKTFILQDNRFIELKSKIKAQNFTKTGLPKTEAETRMEELRIMVNEYPEGSLERKAIEEEIARQENKN